jgi:hypothetical protein
VCFKLFQPLAAIRAAHLDFPHPLFACPAIASLPCSSRCHHPVWSPPVVPLTWSTTLNQTLLSHQPWILGITRRTKCLHRPDSSRRHCRLVLALALASLGETGQDQAKQFVHLARYAHHVTTLPLRKPYRVFSPRPPALHCVKGSALFLTRSTADVLVSSASSLLSHFLDTIRRLRVQGPLWLWQGAGCIYHSESHYMLVLNLLPAILCVPSSLKAFQSSLGCPVYLAAIPGEQPCDC